MNRIGFRSPAFLTIVFAALIAGQVAVIAQTAPSGAWLVEDIGGGGVVDRVMTTVEFVSPDAVAGSGGCNRYRGLARIDAATMRLGPLAMTRMACPPAVMDQEAKFSAAMERVRGWSIRGDGLLLLTGEDGKPVLRLSRM